MANKAAAPRISDGGATIHDTSSRDRVRGRGRGGGGYGRGDRFRGSSGRGRGRGSGGAGVQLAAQPAQPGGEAQRVAPAVSKAGLVFKSSNEGKQDADNTDGELCFICANEVTHHAMAPCNHVTCHICSLRLRALYKNKDCPHCRTAALFVVFTDDATKRFEEYTAADTTSTDDNIGIRYANEDIVGDTVLLLRYNCPDPDCDFAGVGWPDLHRHVRSAHNKKMCDLCTRNKKVFTHEHEMFTDKGLGEHMRIGDDKPGGVNQTGFKGHPLCGFCGERFYDSDKLYEHCRNKHERCFLCDRQNPQQPHYYLDYNALEKHFEKDHFPCLDRECLEKKFVVFGSEMDLKAHQLSEHGNTLSKDVRRDARHVDISGFDYRQSYQQERRGDRGGGSQREGRARRAHVRGRDPNVEALPASSAQPLRRDELAFQRTMAIHSAQSVTSRSFGGHLTNPTPAAASASAQLGGNVAATAAAARTAQQGSQSVIDVMDSLSVSDLSCLTPEQRANLTRHNAAVERASNLLGSDPTKLKTFRLYISNYNRASMTPEQLIDAFFALFSETSANALGTLIREIADLFDEKRKGEALRKAWQNWRAINEDYPSLPGLGGMHGATTSSSGWAAAAAASPMAGQGGGTAAAQARASTRVLRLKNSTRRSSGSSGSGAFELQQGGSSRSNRMVTADRAESAPSALAFRSLHSVQRQGPAQTPMWNNGTGSASTSHSISLAQRLGGTFSPAPLQSGAQRSLSTSEDAFPALPNAPKLQTSLFSYGRGAVRRHVNNLGGPGSNFSWEGAVAGASTAAAEEAAAGENDGGGGGGKAKKKGKKQVLVAWG